MPNKTIYVSEDDLPVLERADAELDGSLSSNIVAGLRGLLERRSAAANGFEEITVTVDETGMKRELVFQGRCVARDRRFVDGGRVREEERLYVTAGGRFAHYARVEANWNYWSAERDQDDATALDDHADRRRLTVVDSVGALAGIADPALIAAAEANRDKSAREYLDI